MKLNGTKGGTKISKSEGKLWDFDIQKEKMNFAMLVILCAPSTKLTSPSSEGEALKHLKNYVLYEHLATARARVHAHRYGRYQRERDVLARQSHLWILLLVVSTTTFFNVSRKIWNGAMQKMRVVTSSPLTSGWALRSCTLNPWRTVGERQSGTVIKFVHFPPFQMDYFLVFNVLRDKPV